MPRWLPYDNTVCFTSHGVGLPLASGCNACVLRARCILDDVGDVEETEFVLLNTTGCSAYAGALHWPTRRDETYREFGELHCDPADRAVLVAELRRAVDAAREASQHGRVVLKSPLDTGRVPLLLEAFPSAKFVFVHRDPVEVLASTRRLWGTYTATTALEDYDSNADLEYIFQVYAGVHTSYLRNKVGRLR